MQKHAGRNGGKGNRSKAVDLGQIDGAGVARRQRFILAPAAALPDRTDGMNHMPRRKPVTFGNLGAAGLAAIQRAAFG